ncbi:MAG: hypothetical protein WAK18_15950 [Nocardioidaceae bacterium]
MWVIILGFGIAVTAVLGPLVLGVVRLRTSASAELQVEGVDVAALLIVAPLCLTIGVLAMRGHRAASLFALAPAVFAGYTYSQIFLGNEFGTRPGNIERFFPLYAGLFMISVAVAIRAWQQIDAGSLGLPSRQRNVLGWLLLAVAVFVLVGIHARPYADAMSTAHQSDAYVGAPTAFWIVKFWDLAIVVPAAVVVGIGLLRGQDRAVKPGLAIVGGYVLLASSVTAMALRMYVGGDPDASMGLIVGSAVLTLAGAVVTVGLYRTALRSGPSYRGLVTSAGRPGDAAPEQ